ncbi:hypothetical protein J0X19_06740 [Hymenobacter sp. BT186]|uniref:DUF4402 domain-containing protein n=1 Tax=Hymenobacter telluris TaxID=2816474 RepID=A0A939EV97_9BACT|nr:hypothetical protein [Hymenobacter telluris]MBO0357636.1 hypothetical protein [Hymenobacter telluris]MBW3373663.1 hypothetical protein [Hymenobacter norwichensis]
MKYSTLLWFALLASPASTWAQTAAPRPLVRQLTLRVNGQPVAADTISSRFFLSEAKTLTLNVVRADDPDGAGLTIIIDRFPLQTGTYGFQEILSGRNRDASYRFGSTAAYSKSCSDNPGSVTITAINGERHWLAGSFRCTVCESGRGGKRITLDGTFRYPVEKE